MSENSMKPRLLLVAGVVVVLALWKSIGPVFGEDLAPVIKSFVVIIALLGASVWYRRTTAQANVQRNSAFVQSALAYMESVNRTGAFPEAGTQRIISHADKPVLASCEGRLLEVTTEQARQYLGTRVKVGGLPIYLGQSASKSRTVLKETSQGELALTAKSLIFSGPQRSVDIDLDKIVALDVAVDGVTVSVSGRKKPFIFIVPNGILWGMLLKNLTQMKVEGRALPAGAQLQLL